MLVGGAAVACQRDLQIAALQTPLDRLPNRYFKRLETGCQPQAYVKALAVDALDFPLPMQPLVASRGAGVTGHAGKRHPSTTLRIAPRRTLEHVPAKCAPFADKNMLQQMNPP